MVLNLVIFYFLGNRFFFFFLNPANKYPNNVYLVPNLDILYFGKVFQLAKFEGAEYKIENTDFFKILTEKYPNKEFLNENLGSFGFLQYFTIRKIEQY